MTPLPGLSAITFNGDGGGVGAVARLARQVFHDEWGPGAPVFELTRSSVRRTWLPRTAERIRFGLRVATAEATGRVAWVFHSHLAVARVQRVIVGRLRRPYAVFLHGIEAWERLTPADRVVLDDATLIVTNSIHTARRAVAANPGLQTITVCPLGFSSPARAPIVRNPARVPTVLTVARMAASERYKGHDQLIDALPGIRRRVPDTRLVFVGTGDDVGRLRQRAHDCGVGRHVTFTGFLPDDALQRAYAEAAVFAMPSRGEGFGLAYLEAMAAGLPCVGSVHDAASEVIDDGVTGYLVDQQNIDEIAARISSLLTDAERQREMGRRGRERWEREFTYAHFRRRLVAALDAPFRPHGARARQPSSVTG